MAAYPVEAAPGRLRHVPALDGLRGVAVVAVLCFHSGWTWIAGGYLGVSVFFTLSGFLITTILLDELLRTGAISLGRFVSRRARRLVPASAVCLASILLVQRGWHPFATAGLRSSMRWAALQGANWQQLSAGQSYAALFTRTSHGDASPVAHFWSLAIEEQFYVVWPLVFLAIGTGCRHRLGRIRRAVGTLFIASIVAAIWIHVRWGADASYLATPARASELLAGAVVAVVLFGRSVPSWFRWVGMVSGCAVLLAMAVTPSGQAWPYQGWLPAFAIASATLIAALQTEGPVTRVLAAAPLVEIGRVSYGVYLFHWPVFLVLGPPRVHLGVAALFALRCAVTGGLAVASARWIESPIRRRAPRRRWLDLTGALALAATLAVLAQTVVVPRPTVVTASDDIDPAQAEAVRIDLSSGPQRPAERGTSTTADSTTDGTEGSAEATGAAPAGDATAGGAPGPGTRAPLRVMVVGDSTGAALGAGVVDWAATHLGTMQVDVEASGACGLVRGGHYEDAVLDSALQMVCPTLMWSTVPAAVSSLRPDVVVLMVTLADSWRRSWDGGRTWFVPTDAEFAARVRADYTAYVEALLAAGCEHVVWLRPPVTSIDDGGGPMVDHSFVDGSQTVIESVVDDLAAAHPGRVVALDLRDWYAGSAIADGSDRPDGTHMTVAAAADVTADWLWPQLRAVTGR